MILEGEQMGLFRKKGRSDIDAWAKAMIQGYKKGNADRQSTFGAGNRSEYQK